MLLRIYGDPILRERCLPLEVVDDEVRKLIDDMAQTMYGHKGVGLAAPQVGFKKRVVVIDVGEGLLSLVNPVISVRGDACEVSSEGCLSLPEIYLPVKRAKTITVEGFGRDGMPAKLELSALVGRAVQHEVDHLNGILIIDHVSLARRQLLRGKLRAIKNMRESPLL